MSSTNGLLCASCGFANRAGANFCGMCGSSISVMPSAERVGENSTLSGPTPRAEIPGVSILSRLQASLSRLRRILAPVSVALLVAGALIAALGQVYLTLAYEPGRAAPNFGLLSLAIGFVLFALGAFGGSANDDVDDALSSAGIAAFPSAIGSLSLLQITAVSLGVALMAIFVFRLLGGSESGWDMLLWLMAFCALAVPFIRRSNQFRASVTAVRERTPDILIVAALVGIFVALNSHDLTDWYYSAIGDEYSFYALATDILRDGVTRPFSQEGVYNHHPYLNSVYQAAVMWVFTENHFWWKFSSVLSGALSIPGLYILGHTFGGRKAAIVSAALFSFSHYIFAHAHVGYNNLESVPIAVWSITLFVLGLRKGSILLLYAAGVVAGLGFYTHYSARSVAPIMFAFGLTAFKPREMLSLWPLVLGFALAFAPTFVVERELLFTRMFSQAAGGYSDSVSGGFVDRILGNLKNNLLAFNYNPDAHTWVSGALLDPISAVLAALGVALALGWLRFPSQRLMLIWFAVAMVATGVLSPFPTVAVTRLYFVVPPLAILGGILAARIMDGTLLPKKGVESRGFGSRPWATAALIILAAILALNALQFWHMTPRVFHHTQEAVAIGAMRLDACDGEPEGLIMVGRTTAPLLKPALESYDPGGVLPRLVDHSDIGAGGFEQLEQARCVIFLNPEDADIQAFRHDLAARYPDGQFIPFRSPSGKASVEIFRFNSG